MAHRSLDSVPRLLRGSCPPFGAGIEAFVLWGRGAVLRSFARKRGLADQRRNATLAAESFLDAAGAELHDVDDWAVSVDLLRSLPS